LFSFVNFGPLPALRGPKLWTTWQRKFRQMEVALQALTGTYTLFKLLPFSSSFSLLFTRVKNVFIYIYIIIIKKFTNAIQTNVVGCMKNIFKIILFKKGKIYKYIRD
jgi:hypothetical protein